MKNKYAIIGGEIHQLVRIMPHEDWTQYAWRIHEKGNWYWIPVKDHKKSHILDKWELRSGEDLIRKMEADEVRRNVNRSGIYD